MTAWLRRADRRVSPSEDEPLLMAGCLSMNGPYERDRPAFTMTGFDEYGRYHVLHPDTLLPICSGGKRCRRGGLTLSSMTATQVRPDLRCKPSRQTLLAWPTWRPLPAVWPAPAPRDPPPRWWVWWRLYDLQEGKCAACQVAPPHVIDHDHATDLVRGLLCIECNPREGYGQDDCLHRPRCFSVYRADPPAAPFGWRFSLLSHRWKRTDARAPWGAEPGSDPVSAEELRVVHARRVGNDLCGKPKRRTGEPCRALRACWPYGGHVLWACQEHMDRADRDLLRAVRAGLGRDPAQPWQPLPPGWESRA